jgi:hypothetical protein
VGEDKVKYINHWSGCMTGFENIPAKVWMLNITAAKREGRSLNE